MKDKKSASLFQKEQVMESLKQSFVKLNPRVMIKNPIMFTVELVTLVMLVVCILSLGTSEYGTFGYNFLVFVILFVTLLFANFAEAIAEARGKAQADSLRKTREETPAKVLVEGKLRTVSSARLKKETSLFAKPAIRFLPMARLWKGWLLLTRVPLPVNPLR
jgi:K+-transporting ATPase ATPase B chain